MPHRTRAFTLVELLVVIAVIALLISILIPALGNARLQARWLQNSSNIRGMVQAFTLYAVDNRNRLVSVHMSLGGEPAWYYAPTRFDLRPVFVEYGAMALTANPLLAAPKIDAPGNTFSIPGWSYYYFPGVLAGAGWECNVPGFETANALAPIQLDRSQANYVMFQDQLATAQIPTLNNNYICTLATNSNYPSSQLSYIVGNPSYRVVKVATLQEVLGCYTGTYDGAVVLRRPADARWSGYGGGSMAYLFAHFQPQ